MQTSSILSCDERDCTFTICLSNDNLVYSFGRSSCCNHGLSQTTKFYPPTQINGLMNIKSISCGFNHSICIDFNGNIFSFGSNSKGQLGLGKTFNELVFTHNPQKINLPPIKQVCCGDCFTICISEANDIYSFGDNYYNQLGINITNTLLPKQIYIPNNIDYIVCGGYHVICKTHDDIYYSWGNNTYGQLGLGFQSNNAYPTICNNWPDNILSIKCGWNHTLFLTNNGNIYSFGNNKDGQLGLNNKKILVLHTPTLIENVSEIQRIECGYRHSMCIDYNNNLWLFGSNKSGQLGFENYKSSCYKPKKLPIENIKDISSGGDHTFIKTIDNKIYAFGNNSTAQLGYKHQKIIN